MAAVSNLLFTLILLCSMKRGHSVTDEEFRDFSILMMNSMEKMKQTMQVQKSTISELKKENKRQTSEIERLNDIVTTNCGKTELWGNYPVDDLQTGRERHGRGASDPVGDPDGRSAALKTDGLQTKAVELEQRLNTLEESSNSSFSELETRVSIVENDISNLMTATSDLDTRTGALEETTVDQETRITVLEEDVFAETVAFYAVLTAYDSIDVNSTILFNEVILNEGNGYDITTGVFTVPSGGEGVYYFSASFVVNESETARFQLKHNDDVNCSGHGDSLEDNEWAPAICSAVVSVSEGDEIEVTLDLSTDVTPFHKGAFLYNGFNGFKI